MFIYYIQPLYLLIIFKKCQKYVKTIYICDKNQNEKLHEDENVSFYSYDMCDIDNKLYIYIYIYMSLLT